MPAGGPTAPRPVAKIDNTSPGRAGAEENPGLLIVPSGRANTTLPGTVVEALIMAPYSPMLTRKMPDDRSEISAETRLPASPSRTTCTVLIPCGVSHGIWKLICPWDTKNSGACVPLMNILVEESSLGRGVNRATAVEGAS